MFRPSRLSPLLFTVLLFCTTGCAVFHPNGRHLSATLIDDGNWPKSAGSRAALAPVAGLALVADAVVVHPVVSVPDAVGTALVTGHHVGRFLQDINVPLHLAILFTIAWDIVAIPVFEILYITVPGMTPVSRYGTQ